MNNFEIVEFGIMKSTMNRFVLQNIFIQVYIYVNFLLIFFYKIRSQSCTFETMTLS
jgi:hypothetical protein